MEAAASVPHASAGRAVTDLRLLYGGSQGSEWQARARVHATAANLNDVRTPRTTSLLNVQRQKVPFFSCSYTLASPVVFGHTADAGEGDRSHCSN